MSGGTRKSLTLRWRNITATSLTAMSKKKARIFETVSDGKKPLVVEPLIDDRPLAWRFSSRDRDGPFGWDNCGADKLKAALAGLILRKATINAVLGVVGGADMTAEVRAINLDRAGNRHVRHFGGESVAGLVARRACGSSARFAFNRSRFREGASRSDCE